MRGIRFWAFAHDSLMEASDDFSRFGSSDSIFSSVVPALVQVWRASRG